MKSFILRNITILLSLLGPLVLTTGCSGDGDGGMSSKNNDRAHEVSRTEINKTGWFGGQTRAINTTYKNSDGSTSVQSETTVTKGNATTITRERKTTALDGTVKTDSETRTITKGTDNVQRESSSSSN